MSDVVSNAETTRRRFLNYLLGAGVVAWLGSVLYPVLRYLKPLPQSGPTGPTHLTRGEVGKLEEKHFVIVPVGAKRVIVFADQTSKLHALSAKCTHEGCTVQYVPGEALIWCACHNGRYDLNGRVLSGPPPRPLTPYIVKRDKAGEITVAPEQQA